MAVNQNNPVVAFVYYTGHGAIKPEDPNGNTLIVHKTPHEYTNITAWIYKLAIQRNTQVFAILDCCRTFLPTTKKGSQKSEVKPEKGCFFIGFGAKVGKPSTQGKGLSRFTSDFLEAVKNKVTSLPADIMMSKFLAYGAMDSNSQRNFSLDTRSPPAQKLEDEAPEGRPLSIIRTVGEGGLPMGELLLPDDILLSEARPLIFARFKHDNLSENFKFVN